MMETLNVVDRPLVPELAVLRRKVKFLSYGLFGAGALLLLCIVSLVFLASALARKNTSGPPPPPPPPTPSPSDWGPPVGSLTAAKAFATLESTANGPDPTLANPKLKVMATSAGLMPMSAKTQHAAYRSLKASVQGEGVLYLLDAKLPTLNFPVMSADPSKHNQQKFVAYRRIPDEPGGKPVYDAVGNLVMKSQKELAENGFAGVEYMLRQYGHYSNVHLSIVADGGDIPVYLSYLWYNHQITGGKPHFKILLAKGLAKSGNFTALKNDGSEFKENDYEETYHYNASGSDRFRDISADEFFQTVASVQTVVSCGGVTFLTMQALAPVFHDNMGIKTSIANPYGRSVLESIKGGEAVYVGQSAGTVALSYVVGSLTTDPNFPVLESEEDVSIETGLGLEWLFPGIAKFLGIPYQLVFRPHLRLDLSSLAYGPNLNGADKVSQMIAGAVRHNVYGAILADYNFPTGQGDVIEISNGSIYYHVGFTDEEAILPESATEIIRKFRPFWRYTSSKLRMQPFGNPIDGWTFKWTPSSGDVFAAGPSCTKPFRLYASTLGPFTDAPPLKEDLRDNFSYLT